jgi:hypothetical protein
MGSVMDPIRSFEDLECWKKARELRLFVSSKIVLTRRQFTLATLAAPAILKAAGKEDKINLAFIGPGGMGTNHIKTMCKRDDVIFSYVCDADSKRAEHCGEADSGADRPDAEGRHRHAPCV